jgi:hypothetical protein
MNFRSSGLLLFTLLVVFGSFMRPAYAADGQANESKRMQAAIAYMLPLGDVIDMLKQRSPGWPVDQHLNEVTRTQLQCLRAHLTPESYQTLLRTRVDAYVKSHPGRIKRDIQLLESSGVRRFRASFESGIDHASASGQVHRPDFDVPMTEDEKRQQNELILDPSYSSLRVLLGLPATGNAAEMRRQAIGSTFILSMLRNAMSTCGVPHK